jgi:hypothetical protein
MSQGSTAISLLAGHQQQGLDVDESQPEELVRLEER